MRLRPGLGADPDDIGDSRPQTLPVFPRPQGRERHAALKAIARRPGIIFYRIQGQLSIADWRDFRQRTGIARIGAELRPDQSRSRGTLSVILWQTNTRFKCSPVSRQAKSLGG